MPEIDWDIERFFDGHREALPLFRALEDRLMAAFPDARRRVQKTQISYYHRTVFACVSFARVMQSAKLPERWLTLTLGLPYPLDSPRVAARVEPRPGRWTTHLVIGLERELDDELFGWLREAYGFSECARRRGVPVPTDGRGKQVET